MEFKKAEPPKIVEPHWWTYVKKLQEIKSLFPDEWIYGDNLKLYLPTENVERLQEILRTIGDSEFRRRVNEE